MRAIPVLEQEQGIRAFFSTKKGASPESPFYNKKTLQELGLEDPVLVWLQQVHGSRIAQVTKEQAAASRNSAAAPVDYWGTIPGSPREGVPAVTFPETDGVMTRISLYDQMYWVTGSVVGGLLATNLPFDLTGIDFSMTALFIVICVERALNKENHLPLTVGALCAVGALMLLGPDRFLAPALALTAILLTVMDVRKGAAA